MEPRCQICGQPLNHSVIEGGFIDNTGWDTSKPMMAFGPEGQVHMHGLRITALYPYGKPPRRGRLAKIARKWAR